MTTQEKIQAISMPGVTGEIKVCEHVFKIKCRWSESLGEWFPDIEGKLSNTNLHITPYSDHFLLSVLLMDEEYRHLHITKKVHPDEVVILWAMYPGQQIAA